MTPERREEINDILYGYEYDEPPHPAVIICRELLAVLDTAERERDAYKRAKEENDERFMLERDAAIIERDALRARIAELEAAIRDKAERQEAFAGPEYTQHSEADRQAFRHAAKMLRDLLAKPQTQEGK